MEKISVVIWKRVGATARNNKQLEEISVKILESLYNELLAMVVVAEMDDFLFCLELVGRGGEGRLIKMKSSQFFFQFNFQIFYLEKY